VIEPYHVLEFPNWVNIVALTVDGQIVLVREYRHGASQILLGLPGGMMDAEESNPAVTAARELVEETGYAARSVIPVATHFVNPANQTNRTSSYLALDCERTAEPSLDATEEIEVLHEDFLGFMDRFWLGQVAMQSSHTGAIHAASHLILAGRAPGATELRQSLLRVFLETHRIELPRSEV
jgi:8-oxo-dGTP pyrophosphatase MutT (NUDIX family)